MTGESIWVGSLVDPGWLAAIAAGFAADPVAVCLTDLTASLALDTASKRYSEARIPAVRVFEPGPAGKQPTPNECTGFLAGPARYWPARRQEARSPGGTQ
jgi:hypothetical protein